MCNSNITGINPEEPLVQFNPEQKLYSRRAKVENRLSSEVKVDSHLLTWVGNAIIPSILDTLTQPDPFSGLIDGFSTFLEHKHYLQTVKTTKQEKENKWTDEEVKVQMTEKDFNILLC